MNSELEDPKHKKYFCESELVLRCITTHDKGVDWAGHRNCISQEIINAKCCIFIATESFVRYELTRSIYLPSSPSEIHTVQ